MKSNTAPTLPHLRSEPVRRLTTNEWLIELLPRQHYDVSYIADRAAIGFAFEAQAGTHAIASDRVYPFRTRPNSLAYVPPGCDVFSFSPNGGEYLRVVSLAQPQTDSAVEQAFNDVIDPLAVAAAQSLRSLILTKTELLFLVEEKIALLAERVQYALKGARQPKAQGHCMTAARLRRIDEVIDSAISSQISIRTMAESVNLSDGFFSRAFRAAVGKTPHSYLIDRRLAKARELLRSSAHDLREIALATGFSSHAHLSATFRQRLGISPSCLRQAPLFNTKDTYDR